MSDEDRAARWAERLDEAPDIDIDTWALLLKARIAQGAPPGRFLRGQADREGMKNPRTRPAGASLGL